MDPLSSVLQLVSARSYLTSGQSSGKTWSLRYPGFAGMKFIAVRKGVIWFRLEHSSSWHKLNPGDGVIITREAPFILTTDITLKPLELGTVPYIKRHGIADYGGGETLFLAGKMEIDQEAGHTLFQLLPEIIPVATGSGTSSVLHWLMSRLHEESQSMRLGSSLAGDHLMQLVMIEGIRSWILSEESRIDGWLSALRDPRISRALSAMHSEPERNWQLTELANVAGMSRAGFARRFGDTTGTTPVRYLAAWRMHMASKALRLSNEPIKSMAFRLGYGSESSFSTAFRRIYGLPPSSYRDEHQSKIISSLTPPATSGGQKSACVDSQ
ncbi:AraC family transcriptional regulator [Pseudomonas sp. S60]|uniref:AraC family transcriptional regulator n=1 Tax=Pseudomonas sp. S60 TaxID=211124 RepID=UPI0019131385|nr:AraC family transcriptional regulator [Pseudomonas sp. S60]MBK5009754.1 AraC family transcriptional regulator [Pseudomonas sp. S60]